MTASGLIVRDLGYSYPARPAVLDGVSFAATGGEAVAVVGRSGAGKSTLFRILAHLAEAERGSVVLDGNTVAGPGARAPQPGTVGFIHQQHGVPYGLSVAMAVLGGLTHSWGLGRLLRVSAFGPGASDREAVEAVLERVGLPGSGGETVGELSVGQRQRVAVARTLLQAPRLIIADEPVASVDPATSEIVLRLLSEEAARGAIVVCAVHDLDRARRHFPRVLGLAHGRIVYDGASAELRDEDTDAIYRVTA